MVFLLFISFIILLRIGELLLSTRNEKWLLQNGATEYGRAHYPYIVMLHTLFIISLIVEYNAQPVNSYSSFFIVFYFLLLIFKTWIILSLGKFWNTKIYHIKGVSSIKKGPYRYFKHPNYLVVITEILVIPLAFHLFYTAIVFTLLNAAMLFVRIREENRILEI